MANVRAILDKVWSELRQANVVDDLAIIEYIAALLVEDKSWPFDEKLRPQKPRVRYNPDDESLKNQLYQAAGEINSRDLDKGTAELFDQHVLFYSSRYQEKGNYPTPRHIVDFMLEILEIQKAHTFADFTCGSGGFLVHRYQHEQSSRSSKRGITLGVDISPDWIRIAQTSVFLHQLASTSQKNIQLYTGDAMRLNQPGQPLANMSFNRIVISPPLNIPMKSSQIYELFPEIGPRNASTVDSDSILAYLLQKKLTESGKGAILVSESTVTRASRKTQFLRQELVKQRETQAVIELHGPTLFPFTEEEPYLLVINKRKQESTWFLRIERDGYMASRGRDLTEDPNLSPDQNDIPFIQEVMKVTGNELELQYLNIDDADGDQAVLRLFITQDKLTVGVVIKIHQGVRVTKIFYEPDGPLKTRIRLHIENNKISSHLDIALPSSTDDKGERKLIFQNGKPGQMIALSLDGRLLGVTIPAEEIIANRYDLRPATYLKQHLPESNQRESVKTTTATFETALIIRDEVYITQEPSEFAKRLLVPLPDSMYPFSAKQRKIWEYIKENYSTDKHAVYFSADQLSTDFPASDILSTLDQLERSGLIVHVPIKHAGDEISTYYYRRVVTNDISYVSTAISATLPEEIKSVLSEIIDNRD